MTNLYESGHTQINTSFSLPEGKYKPELQANHAWIWCVLIEQGSKPVTKLYLLVFEGHFASRAFKPTVDMQWVTPAKFAWKPEPWRTLWSPPLLSPDCGVPLTICTSQSYRVNLGLRHLMHRCVKECVRWRPILSILHPSFQKCNNDKHKRLF